jgi:hypothetical protein
MTNVSEAVERVRVNIPPLSVLQAMAARVAEHIAPDLNSGCHLWLGWMGKDGYGLIRYSEGGKRRALGAHRVAFGAANGGLDDREVGHRCDTPACVNPAHLRAVTHEENMAEMAERGRAKGGPRTRYRRMSAAEHRIVAETMTMPVKAVARQLGRDPESVRRARERIARETLTRMEKNDD